jgi:hypothetical protein
MGQRVAEVSTFEAKLVSRIAQLNDQIRVSKPAQKKALQKMRSELEKSLRKVRGQ